MKKVNELKNNEIFVHSLTKPGIVIREQDGKLNSKDPATFFSMDQLSNIEFQQPIERGQVLTYNNRKWSNKDYTNATPPAGVHGNIQLNLNNKFTSDSSFTFNELTLHCPKLTDGVLKIDNHGFHNVQGIIYNKQISSSVGTIEVQVNIPPEEYHVCELPFTIEEQTLKLELNSAAEGGVGHLVRIDQLLYIHNLHKSSSLTGQIKIAYEMF